MGNVPEKERFERRTCEHTKSWFNTLYASHVDSMDSFPQEQDELFWHTFQMCDPDAMIRRKRLHLEIHLFHMMSLSLKPWHFRFLELLISRAGFLPPWWDDYEAITNIAQRKQDAVNMYAGGLTIIRPTFEQAYPNEHPFADDGTPLQVGNVQFQTPLCYHWVEEIEPHPQTLIHMRNQWDLGFFQQTAQLLGYSTTWAEAMRNILFSGIPSSHVTMDLLFHRCGPGILVHKSKPAMLLASFSGRSLFPKSHAQYNYIDAHQVKDPYGILDMVFQSTVQSLDGDVTVPTLIQVDSYQGMGDYQVKCLVRNRIYIESISNLVEMSGLSVIQYLNMSQQLEHIRHMYSIALAYIDNQESAREEEISLMEVLQDAQDSNGDGDDDDDDDEVVTLSFV